MCLFGMWKEIRTIASISMSNIRAAFRSCSIADPFGYAQKEEQCAITGQLIQLQQIIYLGLKTTEKLVPISLN
jgi:hypothetical protein